MLCRGSFKMEETVILVNKNVLIKSGYNLFSFSKLASRPTIGH